MISITKRLEWDAAHRLLRHEGKCKNLHGHRYVALIEVSQTDGGANDVGRVIDFSVLKERIGGWIDKNWDHGFIYQVGDTLGQAAYEEGLKTYVVDFPTTAENLARYLAQTVITKLLPANLVLDTVTIYETPTSSALWREIA